LYRLLLGLLLSLLTFCARAQTNAQPRRDGLTWSDGQLFLLRNGMPQPVTREVRLPSGARISPNGHVILANGRQGTFRPGDGVDPTTGTWFARQAQNADGTTFLPLPVRLELPSPALGRAASANGTGTSRRYHYEQRRLRDKDGRRLPSPDDEDDDDE
jgi:hypothetical protein